MTRKSSILASAPLVALLALLLLGHVRPALALSCADPFSQGDPAAIRQMLDSAPLIILGQRVAIADAPCKDNIAQHRMRIVEVLKGTLDPKPAADGTVVVLQHVWPGCGRNGRPTAIDADPKPLLFIARPPAAPEIAATGAPLGTRPSIGLGTCNLGHDLDRVQKPELKALYERLLRELRANRVNPG